MCAMFAEAAVARLFMTSRLPPSDLCSQLVQRPADSQLSSQGASPVARTAGATVLKYFTGSQFGGWLATAWRGVEGDDDDANAEKAGLGAAEADIGSL